MKYLHLSGQQAEEGRGCADLLEVVLVNERISHRQGEEEFLNSICKLMQKSYVDYPGFRMKNSGGLAVFLK